MKIAIPTVNSMLCKHFRNCEDFTVMCVDDRDGRITSIYKEFPPLNKPCKITKWLNCKDIDVIITTKIGLWERHFFAKNNVKVVTVVPTDKPLEIVYSYLDNTLLADGNDCFHKCRC